VSEHAERPSTGPQQTTGEPDQTTVRPRRGIRVRTLVFGLALLAISASVLVTLLTAIRVDATVFALVILIGSGTALLAGGLAAAIQEARGGPRG
jgi:hypothetical protein